MPGERYQLIYGFVHCRGRTAYCAGYAESEEEARAWVKNHREGLCPGLKIPPEDPLRYCRAAWCPFRKQLPWYDMVIDQTGRNSVCGDGVAKKL